MPIGEHSVRCYECGANFTCGDAIAQPCPACQCKQDGHLQVGRLCGRCGAILGLPSERLPPPSPAQLVLAVRECAKFFQNEMPESARAMNLTADLIEKLRAFKALTHQLLDEAGVPKMEGEACRVRARIEWLREELYRFRSKHSEFHRRVQQAEASIGPALEVMRGQWKGGSFGRALLAYGYSRKCEDLTSLLELLNEVPEPDQLGIAGVEAFAEHYQEWYERRRELVLKVNEQGVR